MVWHCLKFWWGREGRKLPAELALVMRPGFAAAQPSLWVKVSTADWRAPHAVQGFAKYGITWRKFGTIVLRHIKCIFIGLVLHSASIFSKVVRAISSQKYYNCRYPFSEALHILWRMHILNVSGHLLGASQQLKLLHGLHYLKLLFIILQLSWCQCHTIEVQSYLSSKAPSLWNPSSPCLFLSP